MVAFEGLFGRFRAASMVEAGRKTERQPMLSRDDGPFGGAGVVVDCRSGWCRRSIVLPARSGFARPAADKIDRDHRGHRYGDDYRPAANLMAGKPEIVKRHMAERDRDIACDADRTDHRDNVEPALHLAHP
jgi:hypothetical protein